MQLEFHWQACSSKLYPWGCFFSFPLPPTPLSLELYDSSSCLIHSLSEKVCNCRAVTTTDLGLPCLCRTMFLLLSLFIFNFTVQGKTAFYIYIYSQNQKNWHQCIRDNLKKITQTIHITDNMANDFLLNNSCSIQGFDVSSWTSHTVRQ